MTTMNIPKKPKEQYTCSCGHVTHSKAELKEHNKKVHGDEMSEAVDKMKNELEIPQKK